MSATSVGEIGLDLVVDQNQFNKQMSGITSLAKKAGAALAGAFAVKKVVDFGKQCLDLGSDLQEVQNVVDVTCAELWSFRDHGEAIYWNLRSHGESLRFFRICGL